MKTISTIILVSLNVCAFAANQPKDGFYLRIWKDGIALPYQDQDGIKFQLGEQQTFKVQNCEITSSNNENTRFHLSVTIPNEEKNSSPFYVLFVGGTAYRQTGANLSDKKIFMLGFNIKGQENAKQVSKYLNTPIHYCQHPQYNLLVTFTPTKEQYKVGDEVTVTLRIKNVGDKAIKFRRGGLNRASYIFNAYLNGKQVPDIGINVLKGNGLSGAPSIKPGEVFEDKASLNKWFSFSEAGVYEIHGSYHLDFWDNSDRTIWQDYASADFIVRISK